MMLNDELLSIGTSLTQDTALFTVGSVCSIERPKSNRFTKMQPFRSWAFHVFRSKTKLNNHTSTVISERAISQRGSPVESDTCSSNILSRTLSLSLYAQSTPRQSTELIPTASLLKNEEHNASAAPHINEAMNRSWSTIVCRFGVDIKRTIKAKSTAFSRLKSTFSLQKSLSSFSVRYKKSKISTMEQAKSSKENIRIAKPTDATTAKFEQKKSKDVGEPVNIMVDNYNLPKPKRASTIPECDEPSITKSSKANNKQYPTTEGCFQNIDGYCAKRYSYWDSYSSQTQQYNQICKAINEVSLQYQEFFEVDTKSHYTSWFSSVDNPKFHQRSTDAENDMAMSVCSLDSSSTFTYGSQFSELSFDLDNAPDYTAAMRYDSTFDLQWQEAFHRVKNKASSMVELLDKFACALHELLILGHSTEAYCVNDDVYSDSTIDMASYSLSLQPETTWLDIYSHFYSIFECGQFTVEHIVYVFFFVTRMLRTSGKIISDLNWRLISTAALLIAAKVLDDCSIFNADFMTILPELCMVNMNIVERTFLEDIQWNLNLHCHEFAAAYFYLNNNLNLQKEQRRSNSGLIG